MFIAYCIIFVILGAPVGKEIPFSIVTAGAGIGETKVNITSPSGKVTSVPVEQTVDLSKAKFIGSEPSVHSVDVTFADVPVPNSPFKVTAVAQVAQPSTSDASKVKAYGSGLTNGTVNSAADFTIDTREAGPGSLGLTIDGPTEAQIECFDKGGGLFEVRYWPNEPGEYTTNILFDDKPIPNSPFKAQINPATMLDTSGIKIYGPGIQPTGMLSTICYFFIL